MIRVRVLSVLPAVIFVLMACKVAAAGVVVSGTRVIYPSDSRDVSVKLTNAGSLPSLVQLWIDDGRVDAAPEALDVPFSITPSIARIDPGVSQAVRIVGLQPDLPKDRESVFWLNVLDIPPKPEVAAETNYLQFSIRTRIKLFYRPRGLQGADSAHSLLRWEAIERALPNEMTIRVSNPTAFHVSLTDVTPELDSEDSSLLLNGMVAPFSQLEFRFVSSQTSLSGVKSLKFKVVNDYGATVDGRGELK